MNRYSARQSERSNDPMLNYVAKGSQNVDEGSARADSEERTMTNLTRKEYLNGRYN
jgi:hypothetical protein